MTEERTAARGHAAQREWNELEAAVSTIRDAIVAEMVGTSVINADKILRLHATVQNLDAIRKAILNVVSNGQVAEAAIAAAGLTRL